MSWVAKMLSSLFGWIPVSKRKLYAGRLLRSLHTDDQMDVVTRSLAGRNMIAEIKSGQDRFDHYKSVRLQISEADTLNVNVGAGGINIDGWISLDIGELDIIRPSDWRAMFEFGSIDRILMEHVLEHLDEAECRESLQLCYKYLKPEGLLRIAVPDGYRQDLAYRNEVSPPKDGHKVLYNKNTLSSMLQQCRFHPKLLEFHDESGAFHCVSWKDSDGIVRRSFGHDRQLQFKQEKYCYTSLIIDAIPDKRTL